MYGFKTLSGVFDELINTTFGIDFDDLFSNNTSGTFATSRKRYIDPKGNVAEAVTVNDNGTVNTRYYINHEEVDQLPSNILPALTDVTPTAKFNPRGLLVPSGMPNKLQAPIVKGTDFPMMDILLTENKEMLIRIALAGVDPDRVGLSFNDDYLRIAIEADEDKPLEVRQACLLKGIKGTSGSYYKEVFIDPTKFNIEGLSFDFVHGVMEIKIPKSQFVKQAFVFKKANEKPEETDTKKKTTKKE